MFKQFQANLKKIEERELILNLEKQEEIEYNSIHVGNSLSQY